MSIIHKIIVLFLTIIPTLFLATNTLICQEHIAINLSKKIQNDKNIIVRKVLNEKCQTPKIDNTPSFTFEIYPNPISSEEGRLIFSYSDYQINKIHLISISPFDSFNTYFAKYEDKLLKFNNIVKGKYLLTVILENGLCSSKIIMIE